MKVLIGISSSIAAYKALELIRLLKKEGAEVKVILTSRAQHFVTPLSCQTLSEEEVYCDQFVLTRGIKHVALSQWADVCVVSPATANIIGKVAHGIADDLLSTTVMSFEKPILFVPAMDSGMWQNTIVKANVERLKHAGYHVLEPAHGPLASGKIGKGRFPDVTIIMKKILAMTAGYELLRGRKFLITGGRTEEDLDSLRVVTNRSSGRMARELLYAVACRDGQARGILGEMAVSVPQEMDTIRVRTSREMLVQLKEHCAWCDCLIMAAAIGDYRPQSKSAEKLHAETLAIQLTKNKDVLKELQTYKGQRCFVGFSLEDKRQRARGKEKLIAKGLDLIVLNSAQAIARDTAEATILKKNGRVIRLGTKSKWHIANRILDECCMVLNKKS